MAKTKKTTTWRILKDRQRVRRMVPPVVIRRRIAAATMKDDPGTVVLDKAKRLSGKHARELRNLIIRSKGLVDSHLAVKRRFEIDGLEDMGLEPRARALISNAVNKISEILLFKMVAKELVNDKALCDEMVDLFLHQRFDAMRAPVKPNVPPNDAANAPVDPRWERERNDYMALIHKLMDN
jgi:hypothetical protein